MDRTTKKNLSLFAFVLVTLYCMMANYWILWAGITLMLFADNTLDSLKEWLDKREEKYLTVLKDGSQSRSECLESMVLLQQSVTQISQRLDAIEKK